MDITRSNLPPSPKEEIILRALLKQKNEELATINQHTDKALSDITYAKKTIRELNESALLASATIITYTEHRVNLLASQKLLDTRFTITKATVADNHRPSSCTGLSTLITPDICDRRSRFKTEIKEVEEICVKVKALALEIDEDLKCQQYIRDYNSKTLESCTATQAVLVACIKEIKDAFRAIKRIPDDIWLVILSDSLLNQWPEEFKGPLYLPALSLTHVCRRWRRVVGGNPDMWRELYSHLLPVRKPNHDLLNLWKKDLKKRKPFVVDHHANSTNFSINPVVLAGWNKSRDIEFEVAQVEDEITIAGASDENLTVVNPTTLTVFPRSYKSVSNINETLLSRFKNLTNLTVINLLLHRNLIIPNSLLHLRIFFTVPHRAYSLTRHLIPSLTSLTLCHFDPTSVPTLSQRIQLPNLRILFITPLEHKIAENLEAPQLYICILSAPTNGEPCPDKWLDSVVPLLTNVEYVRLVHDSKQTTGSEEGPSRFNMLQVFVKLRQTSPKLHILGFSSGILDGKSLVDSLEKQDSSQGGSMQQLSELTIDSCVGVSRWDCERLIQLVDKLNVYRTVHGKDTT